MACYLVIPFLVIVFALSVSARGLNQTCQRNGDCEAQHSLCSVKSPTCGGTCQCLPGFYYDSESLSCKRAVYLGGSCTSKDVCVGENIACVNSGTCACNFGFKQGILGTDCVPNLMTQVAGDTCHDSAQCFYSLVCLGNKCGCYSGYKSSGKYSCSPRQVYDSCASNDDCQMAANSQCTNGRCDCIYGYRAVQYQADIATKAYACVGSSEGLAAESSPCNLDNAKGTLVYCKVPFTCSACGDRTICLRNQPVLFSGKASSIHLSVMPLIAVVVGFFNF